MNLPLRTIVVLASGLLCLQTGAALSAGNKPLPDSTPVDRAVPSTADDPSVPPTTDTLPARPSRPLMRMAGISQDVTAADILPFLARNVSLWGYQNDKPTEFLVLIDRYLHLARELRALAGSDDTIRVAGCDDASRLIQVLGYQFQRGRGPTGAVLMTADESAHLSPSTLDSQSPRLRRPSRKAPPLPTRFPLPVSPSCSLKKRGPESALRERNTETICSRSCSTTETWTASTLAVARVDRQTGLALYKSPGLWKLAPSAAALDFYGSRISIRSGEVAVPGGPAAEQAWKELVGASPRASGEFVQRLLEKDHGWLAAYFDALSRLGSAQQAHVSSDDRVKNVYDAYRTGAHNSLNSADEGVFPRNAGLLVLLSRLAQWQASGEPLVPGGLPVWKEILSRKSVSNKARSWAQSQPRPLGYPGRVAPGSGSFLRRLSMVLALQIYLMLYRNRQWKT